MPYRRGVRRATATYTRKPRSKYPVRKGSRPKSYKSKSKYVKYISRGSIFGKQFFAKLKYQTLVDMTTTGSAMVTNTFRANSCLDCDFTGGAGQPLFFQTLCGATDGTAPFTNFRVCGVKFKCYLINDNSSGSTCGIFFIHWRYGGAGVLDTIAEVGTQPNTKCMDIGNVNSSKGIRMLSTYISIKKMLGVKDLKDDEDSAGSYAANPNKQVFFDVGYQPYTAAVDTGVFVRVKATYYVQFYSQNEMDES